MAQSFAVDVGGTFTDLVTLDERTGAVRFEKVPTTPSEPARGVLTAVDKAALSLAEVSAFFHGTTLGINALLEGKGARTGLITTRGFRDVIELRRLNWPMYRLHWDKPEPLVARYLRREVDERVRADGVVLSALDEDAVRAEGEYLLSEGVEAIAVCFLHSYAHPQHELRAGEILRGALPTVSVTLSCEVTQEYREYERTTTTIGDALIKPRMARYVDELEAGLQRARYRGSFVLTRCDGGVMSASEAKRRPARTLISGPASGVMGAVTLGRWLDIPHLIGADMGGTSFDASLIIDHEPSLSTQAELAGVPLLMPVIELATIGSGGGSIAYLDAGGALNVGPRSAGSEPGPVCYGRGGSEPTFTDAALVAGILDPANFLGGDIPLDLDAAAAAIRSQVAEPLGLPEREAAAGIVALSEAKMAATLSELTIDKGHDPRDFTLLAFGGGGSLIASALATQLGIPRILVPPSPGTFSAWGMLTLDVVHDFARTALSRLDRLRPADVAGRFAELDAAARAALERERIPAERRALMRSIDMRYKGQEHVLSMALTDAGEDSVALDHLRALFEARHLALYGYKLNQPVEVTAYRVRAVGTLAKPQPPTVASGTADAGHARRGQRAAIHRESGGELAWALYDRARLLAGNTLRGPAIIEEAAATTLVGPTQELSVDALGNLLISQAGAGS